MVNFVRKLVSGNKARFKDKHLDIELDLVYVTDNIIIMGYPATGVEGFYRNRREDAKKLLDHRHGKNYWVFNFCPVRENSYPASFFEGRVSRYPFPDHHAPPLAILPLFARECRKYLDESPDHVAVLHCKAGKGRSGTLACTYLLTLDETPSPPKLQRSMTTSEWAKRRADHVMESVATEEMEEEAKEMEEEREAREKENVSALPESEGNPGMPSITGEPSTKTPLNMTPRTGTPVGENKAQTRLNSLDDVLALHTSRRMRKPSNPKKMKQGVSIPSQRRWLYYWSLILSNAAPPGFWELGEPKSARIPRIRLREIKIRIQDLGGMKMGLVKLANTVIEKTNSGKFGTEAKGSGPIWVSLARYNDEFVERLQKWEKHTRQGNEHLGRRKEGSEHMGDKDIVQLFKEGDWDKGKMIRSFARLGQIESTSRKETPQPAPKGKEGNIITHTLRPLSNQKLEVLKEQLAEAPAKSNKKLDLHTKKEILDATNGALTSSPPSMHPSTSTRSSVTDLEQVIDDKNAETGVILDPTREVRAKVYLGQVFMGWLWFIPIFHIPSPPHTTDHPSETGSFTFTLTRREIDFAVGAGSALVDVQFSMEWVRPSKTKDGRKKEAQPPKTQTSADSAKGVGGEPGTGGVAGKVVAGVEAAIEGISGREAVEVVQAEDQ